MKKNKFIAGFQSDSKYTLSCDMNGVEFYRCRLAEYDEIVTLIRIGAIFFQSRTVLLDIIKVFTPTDAQVFFFKKSIKIYIKTAPTCFSVITIIKERTIRSC